MKGNPRLPSSPNVEMETFGAKLEEEEHLLSLILPFQLLSSSQEYRLSDVGWKCALSR